MQTEERRVITPEPFTTGEYWSLLLKYRSLIGIFALQEIKTLYAQTYFGIFWAVFRPLIMLVIYTVIFKWFLKVPTDSPYHLFAFSGIIGWNFFSQIATSASSAVAGRRDLIRKTFFPKLVLPLAKLAVAGVEMTIALAVMFILLVAEGIAPGWHTLTLPLFLFLNVCCGFCIAIWMNTLSVRFRDLNQIIPVIIGVAIWFTPVFYPRTIIPEQYSVMMYANPMAGILQGYRFAFLGEPFPEKAFWWSIGGVVALLAVGLWYFRITEDKMVDYA